MKLFFLGLFFIVVLTYVNSADIDTEWEAFKKKYNKIYDSPELEDFRKSVFIKELDKVERQNKKYEQGFTNVKLTIKENADMTASEKRCKKYNPYLLFPGCVPPRF